MLNGGPLGALVLILCLFVPACDGAKKMVSIDQSANNTEMTLTPGQEFEIVLAENPTTGYRWELQAGGEPACAVLSDRFDARSPTTPGSGGARHWQFRAAREGSGRIELVYRRASERDRPPAQTFSLTARIQP